jgi:hypothetical protein
MTIRMMKRAIVSLSTFVVVSQSAQRHSSKSTEKAELDRALWHIVAPSLLDISSWLLIVVEVLLSSAHFLCGSLVARRFLF